MENENRVRPNPKMLLDHPTKSCFCLGMTLRRFKNSARFTEQQDFKCLSKLLCLTSAMC